MRKIACFLCSLLLLPILFACTEPGQGPEKLSDMTEAECIEFIKSKGLTIPDDLNNENIGSFIKGHIEMFEEDPRAPVAISYTVARDFAEEIRRVVNDYYNAGESMRESVSG